MAFGVITRLPGSSISIILQDDDACHSFEGYRAVLAAYTL